MTCLQKASEVLSLCYSRVLRLSRILSDSDTIILNRLAWNGLQMERLVCLASFELLLLLQFKLLHIVFDQHRNFCLNVKIWSTMLRSSARHGVWAACLPSDELATLPTGYSYSVMIHTFSLGRHTHTQNTQFDGEDRSLSFVHCVHLQLYRYKCRTGAQTLLLWLQ